MSAVLYIVATPIGNLDDITLRAIQVLTDVDLVAAEDTRHSLHLLNHLGLQKKMVSLHEHNERQRTTRLVDFLVGDKSIALISDAGTPLISDPGFVLLRAVIEAGFKVIPVPGASSIITALSAAGAPTDQFSFHGFMPHKNPERIKKLEGLKNQAGTQIFFESTHRIERLLEQVNQILPQASVVLAKELTKRHETFIRGTALQCQQVFDRDRTLMKGEFVVLLNLHNDVKASELEIDSQQLLQRLMEDLSLKRAVRLAADITGLKKNDLYQQALKISE